MNKRSLIGMALIALALFAGASAAQAQCSGYFCPYGGCPWYNHIADGGFNYGCPNWEYQGTAGVTSSNMCGYTGNQVAYIGRTAYSTGGFIRQPFTASSSMGEDFSFEYFVETTNMQPGDAVVVYIVDANTIPSQWYLVDTITTNVSCSKRTYSFKKPEWKGHFMHVRFEGNFASTATKAYIDYVAFWQRTN